MQSTPQKLHLQKSFILNWNSSGHVSSLQVAHRSLCIYRLFHQRLPALLLSHLYASSDQISSLLASTWEMRKTKCALSVICIKVRPFLMWQVSIQHPRELSCCHIYYVLYNVQSAVNNGRPDRKMYFLCWYSLSFPKKRPFVVLFQSNHADI